MAKRLEERLTSVTLENKTKEAVAIHLWYLLSSCQYSNCVEDLLDLSEKVIN